MAKTPKRQKIYPLLAEAIEHMDLSPSKKEFARAVLRSAIEYACARQAGFVFVPADKTRSAKGKQNEQQRQ